VSKRPFIVFTRDGMPTNYCYVLILKLYAIVKSCLS